MEFRLVHSVKEGKETVYKDVYGPDNTYKIKYSKNSNYKVVYAPKADLTGLSYYKTTDDTTNYSYVLYKPSIKGKHENICLRYKQ